MSEPIVITSEQPLLQELNFKPYRSAVERHVTRFIPAPDEPQEVDIITPWGETLTAQKGDYLVSEADAPDDVWPVEADIFEKTYTLLDSDTCVKSALTYLVPLTDLTNGDSDQQVTIHTLEGPQTVRAGDFYLAKGVKGEVWAYPKEKIGETMVPAD